MPPIRTAWFLLLGQVLRDLGQLDKGLSHWISRCLAGRPPQAEEEFSLSRYKRIRDIIECTEEKAQEMVDTLRKMYPDSFSGHRILHPSTVLRQRK